MKLLLGAQASPNIFIGYVDEMAEQCRAILNCLGRAFKEGVKASPLHPALPYWTMVPRFGQFRWKPTYAGRRKM